MSDLKARRVGCSALIPSFCPPPPNVRCTIPEGGQKEGIPLHPLTRLRSDPNIHEVVNGLGEAICPGAAVEVYPTEHSEGVVYPTEHSEGVVYPTEHSEGVAVWGAWELIFIRQQLSWPPIGADDVYPAEYDEDGRWRAGVGYAVVR